MALKIGDRVHYRVYPSGLPDMTTTGTVVGSSSGAYRVEWDDVDYTKGYEPSAYRAHDLDLA
jgi:hypothetical protein